MTVSKAIESPIAENCSDLIILPPENGGGEFVSVLVPLLIKDLVFSKALVLASIGGLDDNTQYYFLEAALAGTTSCLSPRDRSHWYGG
jgi:hypothetical protein